MLDATATLVIGVGKGGVRMLSNFNNLLEEREDIERRKFKLLAIDSADDFDDNFPGLSGQNQFQLRTPNDQRWDFMIENHPYLQSSDEPADQGGVTRNRPVARGLIDDSDNFGTLYGRLKQEIEDISRDANNINIWVISSLGGGTGSGSQPLLSGILYDIKQELEEYDQQLGIVIRGVGTVPRLVNVDGGHYPDAQPEHIANAYVAIREIRDLVERDYTADPLELKVYAEDRGSMKRDHILIEESPFEEYFVLPIEENELSSQNSRERMNRIVGDTILYFATTVGTENYPDIQGVGTAYDESNIFTINETTLSTPVDKLAEYVQLKEELTQLDAKQTELRQLKDRYGATYQDLQKVLESGRGGVPDLGGFTSLVNKCKTKAEEVLSSADAQYLDEQTVEEYEAKAIEALSDHEPLTQRFQISVTIGETERTASDDIDMLDEDGEIDGVSQVTQYYYYDQLLGLINDELDLRVFESAVEKSWQEHGDEVKRSMEDQDVPEERIKQVARGTAHDKYDPLLTWLEYRRDDLEDRKDSGILPIIGGRSEAEKEYEEIDDLITELNNKKDNYDSLTKLRDFADTQRSITQENIRELRDGFEVAVDDVEGEVERLQNEVKGLKARKRRMTDEANDDSLVRFIPRQFAELSLSEPDNLTAEDISKIESNQWDFQDLIDSSVISEEQFKLDLKNLLENEVEERISDKARQRPDGVLQVLRNDDNSWLNQEIKDITNTSFANFAGVKEPMPITDPLQIRFLGVFAPIDWEKTSEFGIIHQSYESDDTSVMPMLTDTSDRDTEDLEDEYFRPAYPELFSEESITTPEDGSAS